VVDTTTNQTIFFILLAVADVSTGPKQDDKPRREPKKPQPKPEGEPPSGWPSWAKAIVSVIVVWHLLVVFLSALAKTPTSPLMMNIANSAIMRWYSEPLYLNHGYSFFAPEPGPGHVIEYTLYDKANNQIETFRYPSKREQWPRLYYHRFMMLADQIDAFPDEQLRTLRAEGILARFAFQVLREHPTAERVTARRLTHFLTTREDFLNGKSFDDPDRWQVDFTASVTRDELQQAEAKRAEALPTEPEPTTPPETITPGRT
jgi:hypothetical protein